jgi:sulfide:quinone oxidoreductase
MMRSKPHVIIIGAGPGGLAAAHQLVSSGQVRITLVQRDGVATFLPGILSVLLDLQPLSMYRHRIDHPQIKGIPGEVVRLDAGRVQLADGTDLSADAIIVAPGLVTDAHAVPTGSQSFSIWELEEAAVARHAVQSLVTGRVVVVITSLPYRCPPAPYGLALALKGLMQERDRNVEVVLVTPETRPLQALNQQASDFLEGLASSSDMKPQTAFQLDRAACRDGLLVAQDGRQLPYDLGLFIPPHRRPSMLEELPGNGPLVQVDAHQHTTMEKVWAVGDVTATSLPRAAGVAEAQGRTAAEAVLTTLGLDEPKAPIMPTPNCYIWAGQGRAARIQLSFPDGLPPAGKPNLILEPPTATIFAEALAAPEQWMKLLR